MTDQNNSRENTGTETTVHNPKPAGQVERVNPNTGGTAGTVDANDTTKR